MTVMRSPVGTRLGRQRGARGRPGSESVTWRGRASSGATPGTGSSHRSCGARLAFADSRDPGAVGQPADRSPDAVPRVDPAAGRGRARRSVASSAAGRVPASGPRPPASSPTTQVLEAVVDLDVDEPAAIRRGSGADAGAAAGLAVLALALGQDDPIVAVGGQPDDLEPAVGVGDEQERTVGQPAGGDIDASLAGHDPRSRRWRRRRARSGRSPRCPGPRRAMTAIRAPSGDHSKASTSMPVSVRTVGRGGFGSVAGRPRRGTGASISQICDQPRRRDRNARRWPSGDQRGSRPAPGLPTTRVRRDPSASMTQISSSRTNARRRPSGDHCGSETGFSEAVSWVG